jgi:arginyl-tRNA synthetase
MNVFATEIVERLAGAAGLTPERAAELLSVPPNPDMGDFAMPCFVLAKERRQNPAAIATEIAAQVVQGLEAGGNIAAVEAAGPYVNFRLDRGRFISHVLGQVLEEGEKYGSRDQGRGKKMVIDYSSPNLAKPFSIAHLRSTAIGNSIYRVHDFLGWECIGVNHLGDWGANFGQLLAAYRMWAEPEKVKADPIPQLLALYVRFNAELEEKPELQDEARECLRLLEEGDGEMQALWSYFVEEGHNEAQRIYDILGISFDVTMGESAFADKLGEVVDFFTTAGLALESDGALIVDLSEADIEAPCMLRSSRGTSTYHSRDLAALLYRRRTYAFDKMVYVTDVSQTLHFRQVFKALELAGADWVGRCVHAPFGLMSFKGGKISTRQGNMVILEDVLDQASELTLKIIDEKNSALEGKEDIARQVGISAVVFADLDTRRTRNVVFDWEEVLNFDGETGPYLQYTHARLCSIMRKYGQSVGPETDLSPLVAEAEMRVARVLEAWPGRLEQAAADNEPSVVAVYLIELATAANKFYNEMPVLVADEADTVAARAALVEAVRGVLRTGMGLLGMRAPEAM